MYIQLVAELTLSHVPFQHNNLTIYPHSTLKSREVQRKL